MSANRYLRGHQGKSCVGGVPFIPLHVTRTFLEEELEPSAVERLGGLTDPEIQKRIDEWDNRYNFEPLDMVADPAVAGAVPNV